MHQLLHMLSLPTPWFSSHAGQLLDEFNDVNQGEKALMKLWNKRMAQAL